MPQLIGSAVGGFNGVDKMYPVANGVTVTSGDFVYLASGRVTSATIAGATFLGIVLGKNTDVSDHSATLSATGDSAGTVKVLVHHAPNDKYVVTSDNIGTTLAASHVGQAFDMVGATGAQLLDSSTASTTTGSVEVIEFGYKGNTAKAVVIINEHKYKVNA